jgi:hypothetical protein
MARRRLGRDGVRAVAGCSTLPEALEVLAGGPYSRYVQPGQTLAEAEREVAAAALWHLRVLAGWLPNPGVRTLRLLAGWFEIANVDERLRGFGGIPAESPFRLGALGTAWPQLAVAASAQDLRTALAATPWGDPGSAEPADIALALRLSWGARVAARVPAARAWAAGGIALMLAGWRFGVRRSLSDTARHLAGRALGLSCVNASTLDSFVAALDRDARWVLDGIPPDDLWKAESRWWARVRADGTAQLARTGFGPDRMIGAAALLAVDAWQVRAALEAAARGGTAGADERSRSDVEEVFGALA